MVSFVSVQQIENSALSFSMSKPTKVGKIDNAEDKFWFIKIAMGTKPTAGYGISLTSEKLLVSNNTASVQLQWHQPSADSMSAQVITSPCVYLKLQKGSYQHIKVLDNNNQQRYFLNVPIS